MEKSTKKDKKKNNKKLYVKIIAAFIVIGLLLPTVTTLIQLISMM